MQLFKKKSCASKIVVYYSHSGNRSYVVLEAAEVTLVVIAVAVLAELYITISPRLLVYMSKSKNKINLSRESSNLNLYGQKKKKKHHIFAIGLHWLHQSVAIAVIVAVEVAAALTECLVVVVVIVVIIVHTIAMVIR